MNKIKIRLVKKQDLVQVFNILKDWLTEKEAEYYTNSIRGVVEDSSSKPKFNSYYYAALINNQVVGVIGFRELNPKLLKFSKTEKPVELCIFYIKKDYRKKGTGSILLDFLMKEIKRRDYKEVIVRSSDRFMDTGWGLYNKKGFSVVGEFTSKTNNKSRIWNKKI